MIRHGDGIGGRCRFKKQFNRFKQVCPRLLDGLALAYHIHFGAGGNKPIVVAFDDCG